MTPAEDPKYLPIAGTVLDKHGIVCVAAVKEMRDICDLPIQECRDILRKVYDSREMERIKDENAKLRELVRDWYALAVGGADSLPDWNARQADLEQRMSELGVEVE